MADQDLFQHLQSLVDELSGATQLEDESSVERVLAKARAITRGQQLSPSDAEAIGNQLIRLTRSGGPRPHLLALLAYEVLDAHNKTANRYDTPAGVALARRLRQSLSRLKMREHAALCRTQLAGVELGRGRPAKALAQAVAARSAFIEVGRSFEAAWAGRLMGEAFIDLGRLDDARVALDAAERDFTSSGSRDADASGRIHLARAGLEQRQGAVVQSLATLNLAAREFVRARTRTMIAHTRLSRAIAYQILGAEPRAFKELFRVSRIYRRVGDPQGYLKTQNQIALCLAKGGKHDLAVVRITEILRVGDFSLSPIDRGRSLLNRGRSLLALGRIEEARQDFVQATDELHRSRAKIEAARARTQLAFCLAEAGEGDAAQRELSLITPADLGDAVRLQYHLTVLTTDQLLPGDVDAARRAALFHHVRHGLPLATAKTSDTLSGSSSLSHAEISRSFMRVALDTAVRLEAHELAREITLAGKSQAPRSAV